LLYVEEAQRVPGLGEFLAVINSSASILETAKCDIWQTTEMKPEEEIFGANSKFGSYIDLLFTDEPKRFSFFEHQQMATRLTQLLRRVPDSRGRRIPGSPLPLPSRRRDSRWFLHHFLFIWLR